MASTMWLASARMGIHSIDDPSKVDLLQGDLAWQDADRKPCSAQAGQFGRKSARRPS
jgi:hypothetical protein